MSKIKDKQIESISAKKITDLNNKNFVSTDILAIINNFSLNENGKLLFNGSALGVPDLKELKENFILDPLQTKQLLLPVQFSKYDIRTLYCNCTGSVTVDIYDNSKNGFLVYSFNSCHSNYSIVNVPLEDKSGKNNLNLVITNHDLFSVCGTLTIKITSLC
ncbi:hypothetical protein BJV85_003823 [Clostridium acetobutylicum]|uniref:Uncharacterized protein n=1 Tax=Clostridium acetobutylicum (strain ATCC 824 / DSM 792 / JCM 1419 / IAM 19013 / LMG 5710 / NBRC 13948 / NRRL B-527 / VKM B-1787 / 2291 / W) TaxID=272562 RepID=Q97TE5_CLOAB|nr:MULTISPECIES: hypothetical protein [Clostridium]AAK76904.1 Hypothetical protein CA_P0159 [Clostridium acetobutylicum ATCC 824]ADZ22940.1 Conserved hypothetical protein [Clostridium acetobutylicum EA 2018]AEI34900.1 hypothetical protein SMB_P157 [Clostridium acetobutylicum DSM 1731]AWV82271.1 hypothetical protein DK921_19455 [Clostridium acetobutylicum]MBC2396062.1 hypothetical protein [Clostridium acetobutylicum]